MAEIIRNRTIRPSTRQETSVNYRVHLDGISSFDTLIVNIKHESKPFAKSFTFKGTEVLKKKSLGFRVFDDGKQIIINWTSTQPTNG
ncbi:hypothetical protein A5893_08310 [Pedobacter psychrophilus]|uniref:Uncharacterized protein n=1 Tax=Pedobacter psychrophilus TaxID=1826909 RepID=A0A179DEW0_9SPHI|nr:hypothetical protein [Pedobacter psychrophilus]OAQ39586.1 hypothetical protein A5893_08310 [Pedobacter psychrophilus]